MDNPAHYGPKPVSSGGRSLVECSKALANGGDFPSTAVNARPIDTAVVDLRKNVPPALLSLYLYRTHYISLEASRSPPKVRARWWVIRDPIAAVNALGFVSSCCQRFLWN